MPLTTRALAFATNWFDPATVHQVFEPLVADWQREWESTPAPRRWTASLSGLRAFIVATVVSFPRLLLTPAPTPMMNEIVTRVARYTLLPSLMLIAVMSLFLGLGMPTPNVYILTAVHAIHVIGGIVALGSILLRSWSPTFAADEIVYRRNLGRAVGWYWHFMGGLWIVLFVLLGFWK